MRTLLLALVLTNCATIPTPKKPNKYDVGACVQLKDPKTGFTDPRHILLVTRVLKREYVFKWRFGDQWAFSDSQDIRFGAFKKFESITFKIKCPK